MIDLKDRVAVGFSSPAADPPADTSTTPPANGDQKPDAKDDQREENAVAKAYDKLRVAEDQAKTFKRENEQLKPENENLKGENESLKTQNAQLQRDMQVFAAEKVATLKGFTDPEAAVAVLLHRGSDLSDRSKAEKALDDYAKEKGVEPNQLGPSGGPVNPQTQQTPGGNAGMNEMIRRSAGRQ
jgi:FtsZ-binding cell division protein ZapB